MTTPRERIRPLNLKPVNEKGEYVLYWMQTNRRFDSNHSLDYALEIAKQQKKELIVYEGLRGDYPWNSERLHRFILEGMIQNREEALKLGINYWCYVETDKALSRGLLKRISKRATIIITDDFPCFIIPEQSKNLAQKIECSMLCVDGNSIIPFSSFEKFASAARILRIWIHKKFPEYCFRFAKMKNKRKDFSGLNKGSIPPFMSFELNSHELDGFLKKIPFEHKVLPNTDIIGGRTEGLRLLKQFTLNKMENYLEDRSKPESNKNTPVSGLSPYLHFGYISAEEVVMAVLNSSKSNGIDPEAMSHKKAGDRDNFYPSSLSANHFLDELITWRDIGYLYFFKKPGRVMDLSDLPDWVKKNLKKHENDHREYIYSRSDWEDAKTHDELWNAAQKELKLTGRMHNYMRMLWGKKVIEWSVSYQDAFETLEYLNNKYAYDGRDPNSYTGILWCFGMYDRPWFPERNVFGNIRYMSSDSTRKKFKMKAYLEYVEKLDAKNSFLFP